MMRTAEARKTGRSKALEGKKLEKRELLPQPLLQSGHLQEADNHHVQCSAKSSRGLLRRRENSRVLVKDLEGPQAFSLLFSENFAKYWGC